MTKKLMDPYLIFTEAGHSLAEWQALRQNLAEQIARNTKLENYIRALKRKQAEAAENTENHILH